MTDTENSRSTSPEAEGILRALRRIIRAIDLSSRRLASQHGLTGPQLVCARALARSGPMTAGCLAREISVSPATVTGILDRLEKRGLIVRERGTEDKRQVTVSLTEAGAEQVRRTPLPLHDAFLERLEALDAAQQERIGEVLEQVVEMMEAESIEAAPLLTIEPADADRFLEPPARAASRGRYD